MALLGLIALGAVVIVVLILVGVSSTKNQPVAVSHDATSNTINADGNVALAKARAGDTLTDYEVWSITRLSSSDSPVASNYHNPLRCRIWPESTAPLIPGGEKLAEDEVINLPRRFPDCSVRADGGYTVEQLKQGCPERRSGEKRKPVKAELAPPIPPPTTHRCWEPSSSKWSS